MVAESWQQAQIMIDELVEVLEACGLSLNNEKLKFMSEKCDDESDAEILCANGKPVERVSKLKVLGSKITARGARGKSTGIVCNVLGLATGSGGMYLRAQPA